MSYTPAGRNENWYTLASLLRYVRTVPCSWLVSLTVAPGTMAPVVSCTVPDNEALFCADNVIALKHTKTRTHSIRTLIEDFLSELRNRSSPHQAEAPSPRMRI